MKYPFMAVMPEIKSKGKHGRGGHAKIRSSDSTTKFLKLAAASAKRERKNAKRLAIAEAEDDRLWDKEFLKNPEKLEKLTAQALKAIEDGLTEPLDLEKLNGDTN